MKTILNVKGMHCNGCKMLIEDICSDFDEIESCSVDIEGGKVSIVHDEKLDLNKVKEEINDSDDLSVDF